MSSTRVSCYEICESWTLDLRRRLGGLGKARVKLIEQVTPPSEWMILLHLADEE